jgi:hypothetical protein
MVGKQPRGTKKTWFVDATLTQTVPVGAVSSAAVAVCQTLAPPDAEGGRMLSFSLPSVFGGDIRRHTVVAFPLGADINSLTGPPPKQQRLLRGFVAYYWEHKPRASRVSINYKLPDKENPKLDLTAVNP